MPMPANLRSELRTAAIAFATADRRLLKAIAEGNRAAVASSQRERDKADKELARMARLYAEHSRERASP
jgi:hypothetical protein